MTEAIAIARRDLLAAAGALGSAGALGGVAAAAPGHAGAGGGAFPKGFHWGAATAAHQIEGNNTNSDLWFLENLTPTTYAERSGDACDSYHRFGEDIAMLAGIGLNAYRFSVEWARIEPSQGHFSQAELDYYKRVIATCHAHGITPAVTFFHSSAPRWFAERGGWFAPDAPALFARYADRVARALGDGMGFAFTINEPQVNEVFRAIPGASAYFAKSDAANLAMHQAAAKALNVGEFQSTGHPDFLRARPQMIAGHEQAYAAIKAAHGQLATGVTLSVTDFQPGNEGADVAAVRDTAYGHWTEAIKRAGDFTGVQSYRQIRIPGPGAPLPPLPGMPFIKPGDPVGSMARPEAVGNTAEYIWRATGKPVMISENGLETTDDARRAWYIPEAVKALHAAMARGVPVMGYFHWSLLDNFEWNRGYAPRFGLAAVDRDSFARKLKPSAAVLGAIARANRV